MACQPFFCVKSADNCNNSFWCFLLFNLTGDYEKKTKRACAGGECRCCWLLSNYKKIEVYDFMFLRLSLFLPHPKECGPEGRKDDGAIKVESELRTRSTPKRETNITLIEPIVLPWKCHSGYIMELCDECNNCTKFQFYTENVFREIPFFVILNHCVRNVTSSNLHK